MNSSAFVSVTPVAVRPAVAFSATSAFAPRHVATVPATSRRAARFVMVGEEEPPQIPQGFTGFSENLNGRAAMVGFALAVITEAITGKGIIGQLWAFVRGVKEVTPGTGTDM